MSVGPVADVFLQVSDLLGNVRMKAAEVEYLGRSCHRATPASAAGGVVVDGVRKDVMGVEVVPDLAL